ncbi:CXXC-type zinc finger protein 1-like [Mauremys reevesii]|uniref:CXXC-type zinc finger protein 1-like n=1 Tax=Mauremys reevesii TaxID=260615 RepID=UPI0019400870|nr:CXXC-type zinc finger protein 1-like [Mauremys reevesii]
MFMEEVEDKQWILKVKLVMTGKHTETRGQSEKNQIVWLFISLPETKKLGYWCIFEPCGRESRWKESVEDYCIYCNFVICEKESEDCTMVQCDSCKRWAHMPCITEGTNQENLTDEKKEYKCKKCA